MGTYKHADNEDSFLNSKNEIWNILIYFFSYVLFV